MISYLENSNKFNFRVGGIILSKDKSKVLLHRLSNFNFWLLPGGRVEMMENTEESLIREMEEEIGIKCSINK
ncbi:MAG: NUDIX domain-containing protein, partial [Clostridia bacterium]